MLLLEINEFSYDLMRSAASELGAANLKKLLRMRKSETITDDREERFGLDPWVQWVSIHTGKTSNQHQVSHLGDVPRLEHSQIWEEISDRNLSSGVWGAMNASRGKAANCKFFFPDPWTFSEQAHPPELNNLLAFPRYYSKNYADLDGLSVTKGIIRLIWFCLHPARARALLPLTSTLLSCVYKYGFQEYLLFVLFDLVNAQLFALYYKKTRPDFCVFFMNSIAHLQHHKWTNENGLSEEMSVAFTLFDKAIGIVLEAVSGDGAILVSNAFSQECTYSQKKYLYRQKNPDDFLRQIGIDFLRVEQAMTNDGHVFFESVELTQKAARILETAMVNGLPVFHVDSYSGDIPKIFYQVILWDELSDEAMLEVNGRVLHFFDLFDTITRRSGSHVRQGDVLAQGIELPDKLYNHEIYDYIMKYFDGRGYGPAGE